MASASKKWATFISRNASLIFFLLIILQIPLFRIPCRIGICKSPLEVTSSPLIASQVFPEAVVKTLLYPGAFTNAIINKKPIPTYSKLLNQYKFKKVSATTDFQHLEVLAGSYFALAGAVLGLVGSWRLSLCGILLIIWGLAKEAILGKHGIKDHNTASTYIYPTMSVAVVLAFFSIKGDVRKLIRTFKVKRFTKKLQKSS